MIRAMNDPDPSGRWPALLDACRQNIAAAATGPRGLRDAIPTPLSFDTGRPPGNPRVEALLTLGSWFGLLLGGLATAVTAFFTTGTAFQVLLGFTGLCLAYVAWELWHARRHGERWYREAELASGCMLVANEGLYEAGSRLLPGGMLVTFDPELGRDGARLAALAQGFLVHCQEDAAPPPDLQEAVRFFHQSLIEHPSFTRHPLPVSFAGNDRTWIVCLGLHQDAMPAGKLDRQLWPVYGRADRNEPVVLVPHALWGEPPD